MLDERRTPLVQRQGPEKKHSCPIFARSLSPILKELVCWTIGGAALIQRHARATKLNTHRGPIFGLSLQVYNNWFDGLQDHRKSAAPSATRAKKGTHGCPIFALTLSSYFEIDTTGLLDYRRSGARSTTHTSARHNKTRIAVRSSLTGLPSLKFAGRQGKLARSTTHAPKKHAVQI